MVSVLEKREKSIIAGNAFVKVEEILKQCGLENVLVNVELNGDRKDYVVLDELKDAIRLLHKGN